MSGPKIGPSHSGHPPTQELLDALLEQGWRLGPPTGTPGQVFVEHPKSGTKVSRPAETPGWLPPAFTALRQLVLDSPGDLDWVTAVHVRESSGPGKIRSRPISLLSAVAYVREEWNPQT